MRSIIIALLLATITTANAQQWVLTNPIKSVSEFADLKMVNDSVGFAVDSRLGAILRTTDGGAHWTRKSINSSVHYNAMYVWDEQRAIVVGERGGVYRTDDGFTTMTTSEDAALGHFYSVYFVNDTLGWVGAAAGRIYRSTDGGASWTLMNSGQTGVIMAIQFIDTELGYASCSSGDKMLKSTDGGQTWQGIMPDFSVTLLDFHFYDALEGVGVGSGVAIRTTDGGTTWDSIPSNSNYYMTDLDVQGDVVVACGTWGHTTRSTDRGQSWTEVMAGYSDCGSVSLLPNGKAVMGSDGRIMHSNDLGQTWSALIEGTRHTRLEKVSFMDADTGVAIGWQTLGGMSDGLLRTTDGGRTWFNAGNGGLGVHINAQGEGCLGGGSGISSSTTNGFADRHGSGGPDVAIRCTWSISDAIRIVGGGNVYGGIYRTTDAGTNWTHVLDVGNIIINDLWFTNALNGYAVGQTGSNYRTTDGGITWVPMTGTPASTNVFFLDEQYGWIKDQHTDDGGITWSQNSSQLSAPIIFFTSLDTGYFVTGGGTTVVTYDGTATWEYILPGIPDASIYDAAMVDGAIVAVSKYGDIYRAQVGCSSTPQVPVVSVNGTTLCTELVGQAQWYRNGILLTEDTTQCITVENGGSYHVVVVSVLGCISAPSAIVPVIITGIADIHTTSTSLFPNPANEMVRIERLDNAPATLTLSDVQGRIVQQEAISGNLDTVDLTGLKPGVYLVRIATADQVETLRLVKE